MSLVIIDNITPAATVKGSTLAKNDVVATTSGKYLVANIGSLVLITLEGANPGDSVSLDTSADFTPVSATLTISP